MKIGHAVFDYFFGQDCCRIKIIPVLIASKEPCRVFSAVLVQYVLSAMITKPSSLLGCRVLVLDAVSIELHILVSTSENE